jgi:hypothetical protein
VAPPPNPAAPRIKSKSAAGALVEYAIVEAQGVAQGALDPITGFIPMDKNGVAFHDVATIAIWRRPDWVELIVGLLLPLPLGAGGIYLGLTRTPVSTPLLAVVVGACFAQVAGRYRTIKLRFDRPLRRRLLFHDELLRRSGISPGAMP